MRRYEYKPLDLSADAIRLVNLRRGDTGPIQCDIFEAFSENDVIPYEALSYTWGDDFVVSPITINDNSRLDLNSNLHLALRNLRLPHQDRILWVDAICINQEDKDEKGHQVRQMRLIYQNAQRVIIWLGETSKDIDRLMALMNDLDKRVTTMRHGYLDSLVPWQLEWQDLLAAYGGTETELYSRPYEAMCQLLERPWFERIWTIQEAASARKAIIACGNRSIPSRVFAITPSLMQIMVSRHTQAMLEVMPGPMRQNSWWNQERDLSTLLKKFDSSKASDARDNIYALLGISSDASGSEILVPDYNISLRNTIGATIFFLLFKEKFDPSFYALPDYNNLDTFIRDLDCLKETIFHRASRSGSESVLVRILEDGGVQVNNNVAKNLSGAAEIFLRRPPLCVQTNIAEANSGPDAIIWCHDHDLNINLEYWAGIYDAPFDIPFTKDNEGVAGILLAHRKSRLPREMFNETVRLTYEEVLVKIRLTEILLAHLIDAQTDLPFGVQGGSRLWYTPKAGSGAAIEFFADSRTSVDETDSCQNNKQLYILTVLGRKDAISILVRNGSIFAAKESYENLLWVVVDIGDRTLLQKLLDKCTNLEVTDQAGRTPLAVAAQNGHTHSVGLLVHSAANIESNSMAGTPLCLAVAHNQLATAVTLIRLGADLNAKDNTGRTVLHIAAENGYNAAVNLILSHAARTNLDAKDNAGRTPLDCAANNGHSETMKILLEPWDVIGSDTD